MTRRETPPGTSSTAAPSTPSTALTAFSTLATQLPQVSPSTSYSTPILAGGVALASVEQQLQPGEDAEVRGSSVREGVFMSVPLCAEMRRVLWLNGCKEANNHLVLRDIPLTDNNEKIPLGGMQVK